MSPDRSFQLNCQSLYRIVTNEMHQRDRRRFRPLLSRSAESRPYVKSIPVA